MYVSLVQIRRCKKEEINKMKRRRIILFGVVVIVAIAVYFGITIVRSYIRTAASNLEKLQALHIANVDISEIEDGTYTGSYGSFPLAAEVKVTVENHMITGIVLTKHTSGRGAKAETIPDKVIEAQALDIDAVSGATYSSKVILKAIENALSSTSR